MDLIEHRKIVGRKNHECLLCGLQIDKGTEHWIQTVVDCGKFYHNRMHVECNAAMNKEGFGYWDGYWDCWAFRDWFSEEIDFSVFKNYEPIAMKTIGS